MGYEHIFDELEISTDPFALCELRGACDLGLGRDASATLHYILAGEGEIRLHGRPPLQVTNGTLVLVPAMQSHALHSFGTRGEPLPECKPAALNLSRLLAMSDTAVDGQMIALCAHVTVGLRGIADIVDLVRMPLIEHVARARHMRSAMQTLLEEVANPGLGSRAMIRVLLMQCMIEMLRKRLGAEDGSLHWMAALSDPSVWNALRQMLDAPDDAHSVDSLAQSVRMSRSAFAKRFSDAYGSGPMKLLRDLRMRRAGVLLTRSDLPVKRIAELVGFSSRSAFTRTFENTTGQSPRAFRAAQKEK
ncbi:AraC family transcriptional regulator [Roseobacter sp. YSTF-M11]|uniref:AraC family transcriptional regulator n=1 Tax=Roseobacter insulae TaxID=2859783 RepID=A0A9X1FTH9_9RHOB|nr:helix-turn-helix domain-containing protein [Roseobacter insulae]MBW4707388.1 AraC family transcriptional regulator [Roseobacter insulae]